MRHRSHATHRRPKIGASPGTLAVEKLREHGPIRVIQYTPAAMSEERVPEARDCAQYLGRPGLSWFDVDETPDATTLETFRSLLSLHPLAVADVANVPQRPKHEAYDGFDFVVLRMVMPGRPDAPIATEQIGLFVGERWVLTVQERPGDCLDPVRERLRAGGNIRERGADYLAYAIIDAVVDAYFPAIEGLGDRLEHLEAHVLAGAGPGVVAELHGIRRELLMLRRAVWPLREALGQITREGVGRFTPQTRVYLRDCYDHAVQVIDLVETYRELSASLVELYLSTVGMRTNEVMRVLTIISTIFLPLTFIAGVYGMNFDTAHPANMPELKWPYGYGFSLLLMLGSAVGMLVFFRRKGWLGGTKAKEHELVEFAEDVKPPGARPEGK